MFPLGFLFGLGFDTATEIGLLGLAASEAAKGLPLAAVLVFPALFTAGMTLMDGADGAVMVGAYAWALDDPARKRRYNLVITALSIVVALLVAAIEVAGATGMGRMLAGNMPLLGGGIIALFVASWGASLLLSSAAARLRRACRAPARSRTSARARHPRRAAPAAPRSGRRNPNAGNRVANSSRSAADPFDDVEEMPRAVSGSSIGCVVSQTCSRMYSDGRRFRCGVSSREPLPHLVHAPGERGQPGEPGLDQHHPQRREALEHALDDQAGQHRLAALRVADHLLDVVGRPAAAGHRDSRHSRRRGRRPAARPRAAAS